MKGVRYNFLVGGIIIEFQGNFKKFVSSYNVFCYYYEKQKENVWRLKKEILDVYLNEFRKELNLYFYKYSSFYQGQVPYGVVEANDFKISYISFMFLPIIEKRLNSKSFLLFVQDFLKSPLKNSIFFYEFNDKKCLFNKEKA